MPPYETRILDPTDYDDTELGSEIRAAWAEGVRVIELVEPRTLQRTPPRGTFYESVRPPDPAGGDPY